jgi:hypothetical protein
LKQDKYWGWGLRRGILTFGEFIARLRNALQEWGGCSRKGTKTESLRVLSEHQLHGVIHYPNCYETHSPQLPEETIPKRSDQSPNQFVLDSESQPSFPTLPSVELGSLTRIILAATCRSSGVHAFFARSTFVEMCMRRWSLDF